MVTRILTKTTGNCRKYFTFEGEQLFEASFEPKNLFNSWFSRLSCVRFTVDGRRFSVSELAINSKIPVIENGSIFGYLENSNNTTLKFLKNDACLAWASSAHGTAGFNLAYKGWCCDSRLAFIVRCPQLREWISAFHKAFNLVGEFDLSLKNEPTQAILFMYVEMFFDRGYASGNI
jgi:hypothetical protein